MNIIPYQSKLKQFRLKQVTTWFKSYSYSLLLLTIVVTAIVLGIRRLGTLQALELLTYDWMVNLHNRDEIDPKLLIVEITDQDIEKHNSYPLKDQTFAQLLRNIQKFQPKVIGFDIYREVAYPPGTDALRKELQQDNVIVIQLLGDDEHKVAAPPGVAPEQIGFNDVVVDVGDDVLRRNLMHVWLESDKGEVSEMYSFSLRTSLKYLADKNLEFQVKDDYLQIGAAKFPDLKSHSGGYQLKNSETAGKQILINYRSPNIARRVSLSEVLAGKVTASLIKDKIVLIGNTSPSIKDVIPTPYYLGSKSFMPGVVAHAQMISQIISVVENEAGLFWCWSEWLEGFWVWVWALLAMVIAWKLRHPLLIVLVGIFSVSVLGLIYSVAFALGGWIPFIPPLASFTATIGCVLGYKALYNLFYDDLTQLPNRSLFAKQLKRLKQRNQGKFSGFIAILCLDLERFKLINDGLGYQAGDRILVMTTQRLQQNLDSQAILARVGADEFAIALKIATNPNEAIKLANQIEQVLSVPYQLSQQDVFTSASIGIVVDNLDDDFHPEVLMQASHTAMYKAKALGKIRHEVFAPNMQEQALKRLQLEADLNQAISQQEFELYYQPIICLNTGTIKGFEALVRWHSPTRGFVSPGAFIPIAEETGLIVPMGEWILTTACVQMQEWCQQFPQAESVVMSVNLSSRQFAQANLIAQIKDTLSTTGLNASNLKLEITESMVMDNVENTITLLNQLQKLKIKISMDDFGTGFSSFSYLHRFPINTLKVDRSFVSNMSQGQKNREIVNTIIILAHRLGMDVIAEGIETESELAILKDFNCEYAQGYFFAKPMTKNDAAELLRRNEI